MSERAPRSALGVLTAAQALFLCGMSVDLTVTSLAGLRVAPSASLATLPMAMIAVGSVAAAAGVSRLMTRLPPRRVLRLGTVASMLGGASSAVGLAVGSFTLLCLGTLLVGGYQAVAGYYRYVAADISPPGRTATGMALVLSGGVAAAVAGPYLASWSAGWSSAPFVGSYLLVSVLAAVAFVVLTGLRTPEARAAEEPAAIDAAEPEARPLSIIVAQPSFVVGALSCFVGYFVMAVAMAGAPLAMESAARLDQPAVAFVIQWHMVGMFAPMLLLPLAVRRLGIRSTLALGVGVSTVAALLGASGLALWQFTASLLLFGVGWAATYTAGSVMLSSSYRAAERHRARGYGELSPVTGMMAGSLASAPLIVGFGWVTTCALCAALLVADGAALALAWRGTRVLVPSST